MEQFSKCIQKLKFTFSPEDFKNPALQKLWHEIEAIALAREKSEEVVDLTEPDTAKIDKRVGPYLRAFSAAFDLDSLNNKTSKSAIDKRKNENDDPMPKKVKSSDLVDVEAEARAERVAQASSSKL